MMIDQLLSAAHPGCKS